MTSTTNELDQALHPSLFYARPADVVDDELLTIDERRAILASWASDACAVTSNPLLRHSPFATGPVTFDEIMDALLDLDRLKDAPTHGGKLRPKIRRDMGAQWSVEKQQPAFAREAR